MSSNKLTEEKINKKMEDLGIEGKCDWYSGKSGTKSKFKCSICGQIFERSWDNVRKRNCICLECSGLGALDTKKVNKKMKALGIKGECIEYCGNAHKKSKFKCSDCGNSFEREWSNVQKGSCKCNTCANHELLTTEKINQRMKESKINGRCLEYSGRIDTNSKFICEDCDEVFERRWSTVQKYKSCRCVKCSKKTQGDLYRLDTDKVNEEMQFLGIKGECIEYAERAINFSKFSCSSCGEIFERRWCDIQQSLNCRCDKCNNTESKQCFNIRKFFEKNNISFIKEYKYEDCKNILPLPFDFAIICEGEIKFLLEVDGQQHYSPVKFFGKTQQEAEFKFQKQQERDRIKDEYCKRNNIKLYRIKYNENEIEKIKNILDVEKIKIEFEE